LAAAAGADDVAFPVCGLFVEPTESFSSRGDGRPGFVASRDIRHKAARGKGDSTVLWGLSLRHAETTRLLRRGVRFIHGLRVSFFCKAPQAEEHK